MDQDFGIDDITSDSQARMMEDVHAFLARCWAEDLDMSRMEPEQVGHDFWLTRNGHGAGFWDRGLGALGDRLTEIARSYGDADLLVGDDGQVHLYP